MIYAFSRRLVFMLIVVMAGLSGCKDEKGEEAKRQAFEPRPSVGRTAKDFLFQDMDGSPFRLSDKRGKVVILYFWRMKCDECKASMPSLETSYKRLHDKGLITVAINEDSMHSAPLEKVKDYIAASGLSFINMRDDQGFVAEAYDVIKAPRAFVIGKDGVIADIKDGAIDWTSDENLKTIDGLLMK